MSLIGTAHPAVDSDNFWTSCVESRIPATYPSAGSTAKAAEHRASLDLEIKKIEVCLVFAKKRRNMSAACSRLPPECLLKIFTFTQDFWPPSFEDAAESTSIKYASGWMAVTHVSSAWREFALSTPTLWADLRCTALNPTSINELLRRSKLAPLSLRFYVRPKHDASALSLWLQGAHTQRVKLLSINNLSSDSETTSSQLLSWLARSNWSSLKSLQVLTVSKPNRALSQPIFAEGQQPNLTALKLMSYMITWPSNMHLGQIERLHLALPGRKGTADSSARILPTAEQLTELLSALHAPRVIELSNIFPAQGSFPEKIELPDSLQRVILSTSRREQAVSCAQLWSQLVIPNNTSVIIDIPSAEAGQLDSLRRILASPNSGFTSQRHTKEILIGEDCFVLFGSNTFESPCSTSPNLMVFKGTLTCKINDVNTGPNALFNIYPSKLTTSTFLPLLTYHSARVLHFSRGALDDCNRQSFWLETLARAESVERVVLHVAAPSMTLLYAMARTVDDPKTGPFILFPSLSALTLHCEDDRLPDTQITVFVNVLIYLIHVRREGGSPIQALQLSSSQRDEPAWTAVMNEVPITWF
ncbi:hypothetical protein PENSPDRAFT_657607 [Peniophora sp. CONT]|nr:hypothetical protein PENSPDRAFT_657607 [Peniophora sp. CONT]